MKETQRGLKKITAIVLLTATLVLSMAMTVFADGETIDPDEDVSLTLTKYEASKTGSDETGLDESVTGKELTILDREPMADVKFTVLKVAELQQTIENGTVGLSYLLTAEGATVLSKSGTTYTTGQKVTIDQLKTFIDGRTAGDAVFVGLSAVSGTVTATTGDDGKVIFASDTSAASAAGSDSVKQISGQGLYLVVETDAPDNVTKRTQPFFVSLPMTDRTTDDQWQYDVYAYPKNATGEIEFDKEIAKINDTDQDAGTQTAETEIGDEITFRISFTMAIPSGGLANLGIEDTLSKGLTFQTAGTTAANTDVTVYRVSSDGTRTQVPADGSDSKSNYTVSTSAAADGGTTLKIDFTADYIKTLNDGATATTNPDTEPKFEVEYKAVLNENAVLGTLGNPNTAHAYYRKPGDTKDQKTPDDETKVYTWGIDLTKNGESNAKLKDVEFTLSNDKDETYTFKQITSGSNVYYVPSDDTGASETMKTDANGKLVIRGLKSGTYYLTETKTAAGYILLKDPIKIVITGDSDTGEATAKVNDAAVTLTSDPLNPVSGADSDSNSSALIPVTVVNNKGFSLPTTGGTGTAMITMTGIVLVIISSVLLIRMSRKKKKEASYK